MHRNLNLDTGRIEYPWNQKLLRKFKKQDFIFALTKLFLPDNLSSDGRAATAHC